MNEKVTELSDLSKNELTELEKNYTLLAKANLENQDQYLTSDENVRIT